MTTLKSLADATLRSTLNSVRQRRADRLCASDPTRIAAYWYSRHVNFGDLITPVLLQHFGLTPTLVGEAQAQALVVGSVLQRTPASFSGTILGAGVISEKDAHALPHADIRAVRGPLTRDAIGAPLDTILGDPGLLLPHIYPQLPTHGGALGLVPHYVDKTDPRLVELAARLRGEVRIIDVQQSPADVLREIAACRAVLSSSLHGLITADALGKPRGWIVQSDRVVGEGFKFRDYHAAIGMTVDAIALTGQESLADLDAFCQSAEPNRIKRLQDDLHYAFSVFAGEHVTQAFSDAVDTGEPPYKASA